jgi:hypothetical protein
VAGDFIHFYVLGSEALAGNQGALYDEDLQRRDAERLAPDVGPVHYLTPYGPQVSLFFAPFALLPYGIAAGIWLTLTALVYGLCVRAVWLTCPELLGAGRIVSLLALGFPGFFYLIAFGQNSAFALLCFTAGYLALRAKRSFLAGLSLGMLVFKPQLGLALGFVFVLGREWRIVLGILAGSGAELATALLRYGSDVFLTYSKALSHVASMAGAMEWKPFQMQSLRGFFLLLIPSPAIVQVLTVATTLVALLFALRVWRSRTPLSLRYAVLLLTTALTAPHFHVYDIVILVPALLIAANWALERPRARITPIVQILVYACCVLPLLAPAAALTHLQVSTIAVAVLAAVLGNIALGGASARVSIQTEARE